MHILNQKKINHGRNVFFSSFFVYFIFYSVLFPFQDYFSSYETGQSVGEAKTGEPREINVFMTKIPYKKCS